MSMKYNTYIMEDALEAIIDYRGKTPKKSETGIPTLSAKTVKNNHIDYNNQTVRQRRYLNYDQNENQNQLLKIA